jgi:multidrug resistance efflux pump
MKNDTAENNYQHRSEIVQEIISYEPGFAEKWALTIFIGIIILLIIACQFIYYPDYIQTRATLTSYNGPKEIIPMTTGRLVKLFVQNEQEVKEHTIIGWIESTADPEEVMFLSRQLDSSIALVATGQPEKMATLFKHRFHKLGSLQAAYQTYIAAFQQYNDYLVNDFYVRQKKLLMTDLTAIREVKGSLDSQKVLIEKDNGLSRQSYEMNEKLYADKVISKEEYRNAQSRMMNKQMDLPRISANITSNQISFRAKLKELQQLEHDMQEQQIIFTQELQTLKSRVDDWTLHYVITAPAAGKVYFTSPIQPNQFISEKQILGYVSPQETRFYAQIYLPQSNLNRVDTGMKVQLRFDAYPYREVGSVNGTLSYISKIATDSGFLASVRLENGITTNQNYQIPHHAGLRAEALVITRKMRLLEKLYLNTVGTFFIDTE